MHVKQVSIQVVVNESATSELLICMAYNSNRRWEELQHIPALIYKRIC